MSMNSAAQRVTRIHDRAKGKYLFYVFCALFGVLIAFVFLGMGFVVLDRWGHDAYIRWGGLTGFTLVLFGFFVAESEKFLRKWRFWAVTVILLAGHLTVFVIVLTHVEEWGLTWFMVIVVEYPVFFFLRDTFAS